MFSLLMLYYSPPRLSWPSSSDAHVSAILVNPLDSLQAFVLGNVNLGFVLFGCCVCQPSSSTATTLVCLVTSFIYSKDPYDLCLLIKKSTILCFAKLLKFHSCIPQSSSYIAGCTSLLINFSTKIYKAVHIIHFTLFNI